MNLSALARSPYASVVYVAVAWLVLVPLFSISPRYLPPLGTVIADARSVWPDLVAGFWRTLVETVLGFVAGTILGVGFGIAFGAIVVIWFGNTIMAKVVIALYLAFFPVAVNTLRGLELADPQRIALMRSFGASRLQLFLKLSLPTALPNILIGMKLAVALSIAGAVVGEWFGDTVGLGVMLLQALYFEQIPRVWVLIIACGLLGTLLYGVLAILERRYVWWRPD